MKKVLIFTASRSELHLLEPLVNYSKRRADVKIILKHVNPRQPMHELLKGIQDHIKYRQPDIVMVAYDRKEQLPVAFTSFFLNIPTFHLGAGAAGSGTWDDVTRHVLSSFSHIILAESPEAKDRLIRAGEEPWRIFVVGCTNFDNLNVGEIMESPRPMPETYDLMLMNPVTISEEQTRQDTEKALSYIDKTTVVIQPNEDQFGHVILNCYEKYQEAHPNMLKVMPTVRRVYFLKLLRHCSRFISNSSSGIYEAPMFDVPVLNPSMRNAERSPINKMYLSGASEKVLRAIRSINLKDPELLRKRLRFFDTPIEIPSGYGMTSLTYG